MFYKKSFFCKTFFFVALFLSTIIIYTSCDNSVEPDNGPGKRDYIWSADTIDPGPDYRTYGFDIWGASSDDIWLIGDADTPLHAIWHFDGKKWTSVRLDEYVHGAGVWGFGHNDIWMGTTQGTYWHFDGNKWIKFSTHKYKNYDRVIIQGIHGLTPNDIYGVGFAHNLSDSKYTRILMKYDGQKWDFVDIPDFEESFIRVKVDSPSGNILIISNRMTLNTGKYAHLYILENRNHIREIASADKYLSFGAIKDKINITINDKVYCYENDQLQLMFDFSNTSFRNRVWGRSEQDFFTYNSPNNIGHYNGTDLVDLVELNGNCGQLLVFERDVFALSTNFKTGKDIIFHGFLK